MTAWAGLALGLALLTFLQTGVWSSDAALWSRAQRVAPQTPRPLIGLAWTRLDAGDLAGAEHFLEDASRVTDRQSPREREWARDAIDATRAVLWMRQGRLLEASRLMAAGPPYSERSKLCQHFVTVCALASR